MDVGSRQDMHGHIRLGSICSKHSSFELSSSREGGLGRAAASLAPAADCCSLKLRGFLGFGYI